MSAIRIKPHHFIDIVADIGRGQTAWTPHPYGHAVHTVAARILAEPDVLLEMELGADDICAPCKHNVGGLCDDTIDTSFRPAAPSSKREWNLLIDRRWCERLGLAQGDRLTARQFVQRLLQGMGRVGDIYREEPRKRTGERVRALKAGLREFLEGGKQVEDKPCGTGIEFRLGRAYLDMARSSINAMVMDGNGEKLPAWRLTPDTRWGLMAMTYIFSVMAVEAIVNYQLNYDWERASSGLRSKFPNRPSFESLKAEREIRDLPRRVKLLLDLHHIPRIEATNPTLWRDFTAIVNEVRHGMMHPTLAQVDSPVMREAAQQKPWSFAPGVASQVIAYFYETGKTELPQWVTESTQFRIGTIVALDQWIPDPSTERRMAAEIQPPRSAAPHRGSTPPSGTPSSGSP